jgi:hypothetical protein
MVLLITLLIGGAKEEGGEEGKKKRGRGRKSKVEVERLCFNFFI